jgi:hypothetical protein
VEQTVELKYSCFELGSFVEEEIRLLDLKGISSSGGEAARARGSWVSIDASLISNGVQSVKAGQVANS